jgi:hypothetical protein
MNLASTEFPLRTNYELTKIMRLYNGANDIHSNYNILPFYRINYVFSLSEEKGEVVNTFNLKEPPPHNITIAKGHGYCMFSRGFVEYVLSPNQYVKDFINWCKNTLIPCEM